MAVLGSKWSNLADLDVDPAAFAAGIAPSASINNKGTKASVGHYCYFAMPATTTYNTTLPFDFPIDSDFTLIVNGLSEVCNDGSSTTIVASIQGSVDGVTYVDLKDNVINGGNIDAKPAVAVYDYDGQGIMPFMHVEIRETNPVDKTILVMIINQ